MDGRKVDLYRDGAALDWAKPPWLGMTFPSFRWRKYLTKVHSREYSRLRLDYARFLTRRWNSRHQGGDQVESFNIYYMLWRTQADGKHAEPRKILLWEHRCFSQAPQHR